MSSPFPWRPEARQEKTLVTAAPRPPEKLAAGVSIRKTAAENGALISTVQRIKAAMRSPWRRRQVRSGLPAGGRWIRTSGSAPAATPLSDRGVKPQATAAGWHFGGLSADLCP